MSYEEITSRRFGPEHDRECQRPQIVTCALWECQVANVCQFDSRWSADYRAAMDRPIVKPSTANVVALHPVENHPVDHVDNGENN